MRARPPGGRKRNRTAVRGFAVLCITTLPSGRLFSNRHIVACRALGQARRTCRPAVAARRSAPYIGLLQLPEEWREMARVTVEDCVVKVPNRFQLVLLAAQRAREITSGSPLSIDRDDDKNPVVALREIADETVALDHLKTSVVRGMQKHVEIDEPEESHELELDTALFGIGAPDDALIGEEL